MPYNPESGSIDFSANGINSKYYTGWVTVFYNTGRYTAYGIHFIFIPRFYLLSSAVRRDTFCMSRNRESFSRGDFICQMHPCRIDRSQARSRYSCSVLYSGLNTSRSSSCSQSTVSCRTKLGRAAHFKNDRHHGGEYTLRCFHWSWYTRYREHDGTQKKIGW